MGNDFNAGEAEFAQLVAESQKENYVLRLYVTGFTSQSRLAVANIQAICEEYLQGRYDLEVIDIYKRPQLAQSEQIIATPTLIKHLPLPLRRFVGNLSDRNKVLIGLDLLPARQEP